MSCLDREMNREGGMRILKRWGKGGGGGGEGGAFFNSAGLVKMKEGREQKMNAFWAENDWPSKIK